MSEKGSIAGIDIGTSQIRIVAAELNDNIATIKTATEGPSNGLLKGSIVDIDRAAESLSDAIIQAEKAMGSEITEVLLNVSCPEIKGILGKGSLVISRFNHRITKWDVVRVLEIARQSDYSAGTDIVCAVPRSFFVDGQPTQNPVGTKGQLLEVEAVLVLVPELYIQNIKDLAKRVGLNIQALNSSIVAAAGAILDPLEKGVAVVDIGASLTDIALFDDHGLCWMTSLPIGGDYITSDISFGFQVSREEAERIKLTYGSLLSEGGNTFNLLDGKDAVGRKVNKSFLKEIVDSRLEEIFQFVVKSVVESGFNERLSEGIVFSGAVTKTPGFLAKAEDYLNVPVRIGYPKYMPGDLYDSAFACSMGLVLCSSSLRVNEESYRGADKSTFRGFSRVFKGLFG